MAFVQVDLAEGKVIEDLTPFYTRDKIDPSTFVGESLLTSTFQSRRYTLLVTMSVDGLFSNEDLFRSNDLALAPQDRGDRSWTMEKVLDTAIRLTNPGQQRWGFGGSYDCVGTPWSHCSRLSLQQRWGFGGSYKCFNTNGVTDGTYFGQRAWEEARQKCLMDTENFRKGVQFWLDAQHKQAIWPNAEQLNAIRSAPNQQAFLTGRIAMNFGCAMPPRDQLTFKWGMAAIPYSGTGKNISARMYPHALHISAATKNRCNCRHIGCCCRTLCRALPPSCV